MHRVPAQATGSRSWPSAGYLGVALLALLAVPMAAAQYDDVDTPLLPRTISERDIELRGQYIREARLDDGTIALQFNGTFKLLFGDRQMAANSAVIWIETHQDRDSNRRYYSLYAYLSGEAEIAEPGGTVTQDRVLYISNLRTYGQIVRVHDAHVADDLTRLPLYQQAARVRAIYERGGEADWEGVPDIVRLNDLEGLTPERPPTVVRYEVNDLTPAETADGQTLLVARGGVYFARSGGRESAVLEIKANNAVIFMGSPDDADTGDSIQDVTGEVTGAVQAERWQDEMKQRLRAVYLEDDVTLSLGASFVRADRLYYDFETEQALILDAVMRSEVPGREIPLYVRAAEVREHSPRHFSAVDAKVTSSEFYTPHYHVGVERIDVYDRTPRDSQGQPLSNLAGSFSLLNATYNIEGVPIAWWPRARGDLEASEQLLRSISTGYSSEYGVTLETEWYLFNLLGVQPPPGYDAKLRLDYFSKRGPAIGVDTDYDTEKYFGLFRGYYIHDDGEDDLGPLRRRENDPSTNERGRVLARHRHLLPNDWEATFELSYISDPYYLETYERSEYWEGKEQETLVYLKRARDTEAITLLANWRLLDFLTQTEHLPDLTYRRIGDTFLSPLVLYHESRVGAVRYRTDDREIFEYHPWDNQGSSHLTFRADGRQEAELPLKLGPVNLVPFATVRGTYWDDQPLDDGGLWRGLGVYGVRGSTMFYRVFDDVQSELFDINRLRHVIKPDFAAWWSHSDMRSHQIWPFDEGIETVDDIYGGSVGLRQVWQTKRGYGENERTVDLLTFDVEAGFFGNAQPDELSNGWANLLRPEDSRSRNYISSETIWRLSDTTSLLHEFNYDLDDGRVDRNNVSLAIERLPRLAYVIGYRYAGDIDFNMIGGGFNYKLNEKHILAFRNWWDIEHGELGEIAITYVRKLPRWNVAVNFEWDEIFEDVTVTVAVWPEGIPEWTLGSRRFTGLGTTTGIRP